MKMKKSFLRAVSLLLIVLALTGCGGSGENENDAEKVDGGYQGRDTKGYGHMYDHMPDSNVSYSEEDTEHIRQSINAWAEGVLLSGSDVDEETRQMTEQGLYECIVSEDDLERVKEDRKVFYSGNVQVSQTNTEVTRAVRTRYDKKDVGEVDCTVTFEGLRDGQPFVRIYSLTLVISYENQSASVYEIGEIDWK